MTSQLRHPHRRGLITIGVLDGFGFLAALAIGGLSFAGQVEAWVFWISGVFVALFSLILLSIWVNGLLQRRGARKFIESERVLVRWTYSQADWRQLNESLWQEEKDDWKVQFGCLAFLLALAGMLTGIMIGWEEGGLEAVANGMVGLIAGGLIGGALGVLVAGGNYLGAWQAHRWSEPGLVSLGADEVYASDRYFKGDGANRYIREAKLHRGPVTTLELQLVFPPRPRMPTEEQWTIPVPVLWVDRVEEVLHALVKHRKPQDEDGGPCDDGDSSGGG